MRVVFFGTPDFAVASLRALLDRHQVALVVSRPDRPAGRGMAVKRSPVAALAEARGVPLLLPGKIRETEAQERVREVGAEALVVAAYGQILPTALLDSAPHGGINVHASLLPRWRGAYPIAAAILAGDAETGVSIMRMEAGLDTGPVLLQRRLAIAPGDTTGSLTERLAEVGAEALLEGLDILAAGRGAFTPQPEAGVTHAGLVSKAEGDWTWEHPAAELERAARAYHPWPGLRLPLGEERVRVLAGRPLPSWAVGAATPGELPAPGSVLEATREGLTVMALDQPFQLTTVQPPGKRPMTAADYARGHRDVLPAQPRAAS